ncbi:hypothetical protein H9P43_003024 [Blastocladiella emersonii ATCC 22665]|nr:hypothetical protein H9P43_003024 [Blastocladiella emersonii ATCC 22665]
MTELDPLPPPALTTSAQGDAAADDDDKASPQSAAAAMPLPVSPPTSPGADDDSTATELRRLSAPPPRPLGTPESATATLSDVQCVPLELLSPRPMLATASGTDSPPTAATPLFPESGSSTPVSHSRASLASVSRPGTPEACPVVSNNNVSEAGTLDLVLADPHAFHGLAACLEASYNAELAAFWADFMWFASLPASLSGWAHAPPIEPGLCKGCAAADAAAAAAAASAEDARRPSAASSTTPVAVARPLQRDPNAADPNIAAWMGLSPIARAVAGIQGAAPYASPEVPAVAIAAAPWPFADAHHAAVPPSPLLRQSTAPAPSSPVARAASLSLSVARFLKRAWAGPPRATQPGLQDYSAAAHAATYSPESSPPSRLRQVTAPEPGTTMSPPLSPTHLSSTTLITGTTCAVLVPYTAPSAPPTAPIQRSTTSSSASIMTTSSGSSGSWFSRKFRKRRPSTLQLPDATEKAALAASIAAPPGPPSPSAPPRPLRSAPITNAPRVTLGAWSPGPLTGPLPGSGAAGAVGASPATTTTTTSTLASPLPPLPASPYSHDLARRIRRDLVRRYVYRGAKRELNLAEDVHARVVAEWDAAAITNCPGAAAGWAAVDAQILRVAEEVRRMIRGTTAWAAFYHHRRTGGGAGAGAGCLARGSVSAASISSLVSVGSVHNGALVVGPPPAARVGAAPVGSLAGFRTILGGGDEDGDVHASSSAAPHHAHHHPASTRVAPSASKPSVVIVAPTPVRLARSASASFRPSSRSASVSSTPRPPLTLANHSELDQLDHPVLAAAIAAAASVGAGSGEDEAMLEPVDAVEDVVLAASMAGTGRLGQTSPLTAALELECELAKSPPVAAYLARAT